MVSTRRGAKAPRGSGPGGGGPSCGRSGASSCARRRADPRADGPAVARISGPAAPAGRAGARSGEARRGVGRPPPGLRPAAGTDARRRNKSKVWTRKTHDALRAAGFRAAQLRDRLEWVDAQRRSGREHGEEARQRSHRKGTSRWATAAAGCRPSSNSQIRRTRLLDPGGLIARRMSASNTRLRIKEALVPSTKNTASSRPHRSLMHQIRRAQIPGRARARGLRPRA